MWIQCCLTLIYYNFYLAVYYVYSGHKISKISVKQYLFRCYCSLRLLMRKFPGNLAFWHLIFNSDEFSKTSVSKLMNHPRISFQIWQANRVFRFKFDKLTGNFVSRLTSQPVLLFQDCPSFTRDLTKWFFKLANESKIVASNKLEHIKYTN